MYHVPKVSDEIRDFMKSIKTRENHFKVSPFAKATSPTSYQENEKQHRKDQVKDSADAALVPEPVNLPKDCLYFNGKSAMSRTFFLKEKDICLQTNKKIRQHYFETILIDKTSVPQLEPDNRKRIDRTQLIKAPIISPLLQKKHYIAANGDSNITLRQMQSPVSMRQKDKLFKQEIRNQIYAPVDEQSNAYLKKCM